MKQKIEKINKILNSNKDFRIQNNSYCFLAGDRLPASTSGEGLLAKIQEKCKQNGRLYNLLVNIFSPVFITSDFKKQINILLTQYNSNDVILNLGSGPDILKTRKDIINVDIFAFDNVDIVADAEDLPIRDNSVDLVINRAMMEHVKNPEKVVACIHRILKANGEALIYIPFIQPFHAAPHDYCRWTLEGSRQLLSDFRTKKIRIGAGPTSGMLWVFQKWLAILLSFGSKYLHDIIFLSLMIITAPIKLLDIILVHFPNAEKISSGFFIIVRK